MAYIAQNKSLKKRKRLLGDAAGALEGVPEKHRYRHGADAAWNWSNRACDFGAAFEISIAYEAEPLRLRGVGNSVHSDVNHDGALFKHVAGKRVGPPCRTPSSGPVKSQSTKPLPFSSGSLVMTLPTVSPAVFRIWTETYPRSGTLTGISTAKVENTAAVTIAEHAVRISYLFIPPQLYQKQSPLRNINGLYCAK